MFRNALKSTRVRDRSLPGKSKNIEREFEDAHKRLLCYYFSRTPLYISHGKIPFPKNLHK
jgi:hypothetical protein